MLKTVKIKIKYYILEMLKLIEKRKVGMLIFVINSVKYRNLVFSYKN